MADYSLGYGGIGSGLDITGMVTKLVAAERAPADARLNRASTGVNFKLSALGKVSTAFDALDKALQALKATDAFNARTATVGSADTVLAATAGKGTPTGRYEVEVQQLATASKWVSGSAIDPDTVFGAGQLTLQAGDTLLTVEIAEGSSLAAVRDAINEAARGHGIQASVLNANGGLYLSLASDRTGAAHAMSLSFDQGDPALQSLAQGLAARSVAQDARVLIDALVVESAQNRIEGVVPGLVLDLKTPGSGSVTVAGDTAANRQKLQDFVNAYNTALTTIGTVTRYDAESETPSALTGDAQMRGAASQLRGRLGDLLGELSRQGLDAATLGLQTRGYPNPDGSLVLDAAKFDTALAANPEVLRSAFTGAGGFADRMHDTLQGYLGTGGALGARTAGLNRQLQDITSQRTALDVRMERVGDRYKAQFVALDAMIAQMSSTSDYLAQQLAALRAQTS